MKPVKKQRTIIVDYWACNVPGHHHMTKQVAAECIARRASVKTPAPKDEFELRKAKIALDVIGGRTFKAVGADVERSVETVRSLFHSAIVTVCKRADIIGKWPGAEKSEYSWPEIKEVRANSAYWSELVKKYLIDYTPKKPTDFMGCLSERARNVLRAEQATTPEAARNRVLYGPKIPNCGKVCAREILEAAGRFIED